MTLLYKNFYYHDMDKGLLDSIVMIKNGDFFGKTEYTIEDDKISEIYIFNDEGVLGMRTTF